MHRVISALHFDWRDIPHCLDRATRELGLDGVELSWHDSFARPHCTREDCAALARLPAGHGTVLSAHIWDDLPALGPWLAEQSLRRWLDLCEHTGVRELVLHGGTHEDRRAGVELMRGILGRSLPDFEQAGVVLNLENHYAWSTTTATNCAASRGSSARS
jgi:sugar phosphate isomerase/epimerase